MTAPSGDQLAAFLFNAIHDARDDNVERATEDDPNQAIYQIFADTAEWLLEDDRYQRLVLGVAGELEQGEDG